MSRGLGGHVTSLVLLLLLALQPISSGRPPAPPPDPAWAAAIPRAAGDAAGVARELRRLRREGRLDEALALAVRQPRTVARDARVRGEQVQILLDQGAREQAAQLAALDHTRGALPMPLAVARTRLQFLSGQVESARKNLQLMLASRPEHLDLLTLQVSMDTRAGDFASAGRTLEAIRPELNQRLSAQLETNLLKARAVELMGSDDLLERAVPLLQRAHELRPERDDVTGLLVRALARWHRSEQAEQLALEALGDEAKGRDEADAANESDGPDEVNKAHQSDEERPELLYALAFVRRTQMRDQEAAALYRQVLELDPDHELARVGLARCELIRGEVSQARDQVQVCLRDDPRNLDALLLLADVEGQQGHWDAAASVLEQLLEIKPRHLRGLWQLSRVRAHQGRPEQVIELVQRYQRRVAQLSQTAEARSR